MFRAVRRYSSATFWLESRLDSASSGHRIPVSEAVPISGPTRSVRDRHATPFLKEEDHVCSVFAFLLCGHGRTFVFDSSAGS